MPGHCEAWRLYPESRDRTGLAKTTVPAAVHTSTMTPGLVAATETTGLQNWIELLLLPPVSRIRSHTGKILYKTNNRHKGEGTEPTKQEAWSQGPGSPPVLLDINPLAAEWGRFSTGILGQETEHWGHIS